MDETVTAYLIVLKSGKYWTTAGPYVDEKEAKWCLKNIRKDTKAAIVLTEDIAKMAGIV